MYALNQYEVELYDGVTTSTGEKGDFAPGYFPVTVRALAVAVAAASAATTAAVITFYRNTLGTTTTTNRTTIDTITVPAAAAAGKVYYVDGLNVEVEPGQELQAVVTTASTTTGTVFVKALVETGSEIPANDTSMVESA